MQTDRAPYLPPDPHLERLLDQALADSFPASDPVSSLAEDELPPEEPSPKRNDA